jgi:hypothetical protein
MPHILYVYESRMIIFIHKLGISCAAPSVEQREPAESVLVVGARAHCVVALIDLLMHAVQPERGMPHSRLHCASAVQVLQAVPPESTRR